MTADATSRLPEAWSLRCERLLDGFEPSFEFKPVDPLPASEYEERFRRLRREAVVGGYDAVLLHTDIIGWYHTSNSYLRYMCDWAREGLLVVPSDADKAPVMLSFFGSSVLLPPFGEPVLVEEIWQVAPWSREYLDRPGNGAAKTAQATAGVLERLGLAGGSFAIIGDRTSAPYWAGLQKILPKAAFASENGFLDRMQRIRSPREQDIVRAAAQLVDIGIQAACHATKPGVTDHEIYAAFTFAQLDRKSVV